MTKFVGDSFQILITPSIPFNSIQHILIESFTVYNALGNLLSIRYNGNTLKISGLEFSSFLAFSPTIYMIQGKLLNFFDLRFLICKIEDMNCNLIGGYKGDSASTVFDIQFILNKCEPCGSPKGSILFHHFGILQQKKETGAGYKETMELQFVFRCLYFNSIIMCWNFKEGCVPGQCYNSVSITVTIPSSRLAKGWQVSCAQALDLIAIMAIPAPHYCLPLIQDGLLPGGKVLMPSH